MTPNRRSRAALTILAVLAAWALRLILLDHFPLREDEAIYSYWARTVLTDPRFLTVWPDKPPMFLWFQAAALHLFGETAAGARILSIAAGVATVPLVGAIAYRIFGGRSAVTASWLMALSPVAVSFSPTAYTDTLLVFWGMLGIALALRGNWLGAGLALAAAIMTKQQGLLFLPLIALLPLAVEPRDRLAHSWSLLLAGCALIVVPILLWDASRWAVAPSPWDLGVHNYGPLALAATDSLRQRSQEWGGLLWYLAGSNWVWMAWLLLVVVGLTLRVQGRAPRPNNPLAAWLLLTWSAAFIVLHIATTIPPWDRYVLPLAPLFALSVAGIIELLPFSPVTAAVGVVVAAMLLLPPALTSARGGYPIGGDHGDLVGLDEAAGWVRARPAVNTVLYHRMLGWQLNFYLFDAVQDLSVKLRWVPSAVYLADNAAKSPGKQRLLIEPDWAPTRGLAQQMAARQLSLTPKLRSGHMIIYEIAEIEARPCTWCVSRTPLWPTVATDALPRTPRP